MSLPDYDAIQDIQTGYLLETFHVPIHLERQVLTQDGQGGVATSGRQLVGENPVDRYFGGVTYHHLGFEQSTTMGESKNIRQVLIGPRGDDIQKDDEFNFQGERWRVVYVYPEEMVRETKGECEWIGRAHG